MRMLGRELVGLRTFGYRRVPNRFEATLGVVFGPTDPDRALGSSFSQYYDALAGTRNAADILQPFS
jgi:hypothetical protein